MVAEVEQRGDTFSLPADHLQLGEDKVIPINRLKVGMRVRYCTDYPIGENGTVVSWNDTFIFVKYDYDIHRLGMAGATAQATYPTDLVEIQLDKNDKL